MKIPRFISKRLRPLNYSHWYAASDGTTRAYGVKHEITLEPAIFGKVHTLIFYYGRRYKGFRWVELP